jgi:hypothetical protein
MGFPEDILRTAHCRLDECLQNEVCSQWRETAARNTAEDTVDAIPHVPFWIELSFSHGIAMDISMI